MSGRDLARKPRPGCSRAGPSGSRSHPRRVAGMAAHIAQIGRLPLLDVLIAAIGPLADERDLMIDGRVGTTTVGVPVATTISTRVCCAPVSPRSAESLRAANDIRISGTCGCGCCMPRKNSRTSSRRSGSHSSRRSA